VQEGVIPAFSLDLDGQRPLRCVPANDIKRAATQDSAVAGAGIVAACGANVTTLIPIRDASARTLHPRKTALRHARVNGQIRGPWEPAIPTDPIPIKKIIAVVNAKPGWRAGMTLSCAPSSTG